MDEDIINSIIDGDVIEEESHSDEFLEDFIIEAKDHIENIEMGILKLEKEKDNYEIIDNIFRSVHSLKGLSGFVNQKNIEQIAHETENILVDIRKKNYGVNKLIIDKILLSSDYIKQICININLNEDEVFLKNIEKNLKELEELRKKKIKFEEDLKEEINLEEDIFEELIENQINEYTDLKLDELELKEKKLDAKEILLALRKQEESSINKFVEISSYVRLPVNKIDEIVNMIGELMIVYSQIIQESNEKSSKQLRAEKIIKDLQISSMSLRMISLKSTFQKIERIARDTISKVDKQIETEILGEDTEIDRNIAEKILEPLVHIVKNAIYHGIESEKEREKTGKSIIGNIKIEAFSKRGIIYIRVSDDGKGLDYKKIYEKAKEKKIIDLNKEYSEDEIIEFVFLPGFSTVNVANNIAGRGVGLDVVKTEVKKVDGKIELESKLNKGTTITLKLPINMAAINGTIIKIKKERFIIPTIYIKKIVKNETNLNISVSEKNKMLKIKDKIIPLISNKKIFGDKYDENGKIIIILELEEKQKAIIVDDIIERREVVVKSLSDEYLDIKTISGGSILGDGKVALILDVENIFKI